jgi:hypothetical protein
LNWVMGAAATPAEFDTALFRKMRAFQAGTA